MLNQLLLFSNSISDRGKANAFIYTFIGINENFVFTLILFKQCTMGLMVFASCILKMSSFLLITNENYNCEIGTLHFM